MTPCRRVRPHLGSALAALALLLGGSASAGTTLDFWTIQLAPRFSPYVEASIARYQADHPGTTIRWHDVALGSLDAELSRAFEDGDAPDVLNVNVPLALDYAERGWLRDLSPALGAADRSRYFAKLLASFEIGGRQLALPWYLTEPVLFYDPELFRKAGLDPGRPPSTTSEALAAARQIHARLGIPGIMPDLAGQQLLYRFLEAGLPVLTPAGTRAAFDTPAHAAFLGELVDLFEQGVIPRAAFEQGQPAAAADAFVHGRLAMITANAQLLTRLKEADPRLYARVEVAPYPLGPGRVLHAPLMGLAVTSAARHPAAALAFARYLTGAERQLAFARVTAVMPSARAAAQAPFFTAVGTASTPEARAREVAAAELPYARDLTMPLPSASVLFQHFQKDVEEAFFAFRTPQGALHDAARFWDAAL